MVMLIVGAFYSLVSVGPGAGYDRGMRASLAVALLLPAACSGSSSSPDARPADAYDTAKCLIKGVYGALGSVTGTAGTTGGATTITVTLDPGPPGKDDLFFKLVPNKGAFSSGAPAPGTYTIAGADANYNGCGLCTLIIAGIMPTTGPSKFYMAQSGTVTLTSVTPPIHGTAMNLEFAEIDISTGNTVTGGCTASITSVDFSTP